MREDDEEWDDDQDDTGKMQDLVEYLMGQLRTVDAYVAAADTACAEIPCADSTEARREASRLIQYMNDLVDTTDVTMETASARLEAILRRRRETPKESPASDSGVEDELVPTRPKPTREASRADTGRRAARCA